MPELLLELFSEEIPARMQRRAAEDLRRLVVEGLAARGLVVGEAQSFVTPRRLTLVVKDVPAASPAISEERKGPRVGAPEAAVQGFLKAAGLTSLDEAVIVPDPKKGDSYVARIDKPGRPAKHLIAEVVPEVCSKFPWPKAMRWGASPFRWVRPLHGMVCLLDGDVVPFMVAGVASGNTTHGHRVLTSKPFAVASVADYGEKLAKHHVLLDSAERAARITREAEALAKKAKLTLVPDDALAIENAGLTEWPTVLIGTFDKAFLEVPAECLTMAMKTHQKCFSLKNPKTKALANKFLLVTNLVAKDEGAAIIAGNEKVIRARLADARFFWEQDLARPLDDMAGALSGVTFHEKLGTQKDRVERVAELAAEIAGAVDADPEDSRRAAQLAKADLMSGMVGEFPELQGLMGRTYAERSGAKPEIARAIELHYKPKGPSDTVPRVEDGDAVAVAVALADKLDTLVGFWAIGEKPTGSGDPYQLRRAALGVIRIVLENDLRVKLLAAFGRALAPPFLSLAHKGGGDAGRQSIVHQQTSQSVKTSAKSGGGHHGVPSPLAGEGQGEGALAVDHVSHDLLSFFADRLKVHLRDKGARHDLIDAVFALPGQDDLALIVKRVDALGHFLATEDGASLLAGVKRAANILAIEEKKDKRSYAGAPDGKLLKEPAERALAATLAKVAFDTKAAINVENFEGAMRALAELRPPVDAFFDKVTVNTDDASLRENRLKLLSEIRAATLNVADFSKISGTAGG